MILDDSWRLDSSQGNKPLDFGADGLTGSVGPEGRLIALNTYHPRFGYATLTSADPFPEGERYNPAAVRAYRAGLAELGGFGPVFNVPISAHDAFLLEHAIPQFRLTLADGSSAECTTFIVEQGAFQVWQCPAAQRWQGRLSLQRCAYTQLTEGGPVEMPSVVTHAAFADGTLTLYNPALGLAAAIAGFAPGDSWERQTDGPVDLDLPGQAGNTALVYAFGLTPEAARANAAQLAAQDAPILLQRERARRAAEPPAHMPRGLARGPVYGQMLAIPVGEARCILTDHMLLPLSWNRDAYYVARMLLRWPDDYADIVLRHLLWMFEVAERPDGMWGRCYLANGRIKDQAFQLDQQLFPLLELAEYVRVTGDEATWGTLRPHIIPVLERLMARKHRQGWLFPTDETPADDPLVLPYHLSSHILFWRTFRQLAEVDDNHAWESLAEMVRDAVMQYFIVENDSQRLFAYAIDGVGHHHLYHDANDFPLALAPAWGFIPADDPVWRATVDFAFSPDNEEGYYAGRLGSVHTHAPWPLGDVQDMIIARALNDPERERRALERLDSAAQWDGALPEAVDADSGAVVSRHWFAWPNAALTAYAGSS